MPKKINVTTFARHPVRRKRIAEWLKANITYPEAHLAEPWAVDGTLTTIYEFLAQSLINVEAGEQGKRGRVAVEEFVHEYMHGCAAEAVADVVLGVTRPGSPRSTLIRLQRSPRQSSD